MSKQQLKHTCCYTLFVLLTLSFFGCAKEIEPNLTPNSCIGSGPLTISDLSTMQSQATVGPYQVNNLAVSEQVFIDRPFTYTVISDELKDLPYIVTANEDKKSDPTNNQFLTFSVNKQVLIRVAIDTRINPVPAWLNGWGTSSVTIQDNDTNTPRKIYQKTFSNCSVQLGGNGGSNTASMYTVIVQDISVAIPGETPPAPIAIDDNATTTVDTATKIAVLANDIVSDVNDISVSEDSSPSNGVINIENDNSITYIPSTAFIGTDSFVYQISDALSRTSTATVHIKVNCVDCASNKSINLNWTANPATDNIIGYRIYRGPTANQVDSLYEDISINRAGFPASNPTVSYNAGVDLGMMAGDDICFRLSAYNSVGESAASTAVCSGPI